MMNDPVNDDSMSDLAQHGVPANASADLFWTATRYVLDELTPAERAEFEERLASDEAACLAVANAVQLTVGVQAASERPVTIRPVEDSRPRRAAVWPAWLAGAALLAAGIAVFTPWPSPTLAPVDLASAELLDRWTQTKLLSDADGLDDFDPEADVLDDTLAAPQWMVQAVRITTNSKPLTP